MRMIHPRDASSALLLLSHLFLLCAASPADVEVDLVFPVANETYKQMWPFPITFAIRNASQLWQEDDEVASFSVSWDVWGLQRQDNVSSGQRHLQAGGGFWSTLPQNRAPRPDNGVHLFFDTLNTNIINATERAFLLDYSTALSFACPPNTTVAPKAVRTWGHIIFHLDPESPRMPDFAQMDSSCPLPITHFEFTDFKFTFNGERCMEMAPTRQADPCGLKLDAETLANQTRTAMLEFAACPNGTWPDPEGRLGPQFCNAPKSSSSARELNGKLLVLSVITGIIAVCNM
ncbi:hypothetical protein CSOJ01_15401 [Colletotrichum sojae]|uniref:DUF7136 domain-containing protein n=1 Tax=Colletotrichum sojae TaxID=2175907 RepID=A0A8H6INB2_9PEZI|nr:hypothetical protein CSOJ01_15401 [Colletotrichum sojae]